LKSALVVINPISGAGRADAGGAAEVEGARAVLARGGYQATVVVTKGPGHASAATRQACSDGAALVVAWGGDGTMNEVARELAFGEVPLALVPAGSGNGLARDLGVPREPMAALEAATAGQPWRIDAGEIDGGLFFNVAGLGLDARIAHAFAANRGRRGFLRYLQIGSQEMLRYQARTYEVEWDGGGRTASSLFVAMANSRQYGSHGFIAPSAVLDDGQLDLVVVDDLPLWQIVTRLPAFFRGTLQAGPGLTMQPCRELRITPALPWELHLDGEPRSGTGSLEVRVHARALRVIRPPHSTTPQAVSL
jgi:diacylglycerol kinase (ATP)